MDQEAIVTKTAESPEAGIDPHEIIENGLLPGLNTIGELFEDEKIFLPELLKSAQIFQKAMGLLQPKIQEHGASMKKRHRRPRNGRTRYALHWIAVSNCYISNSPTK